MDDQQPTKEAIAPEGGSETAPPTPTDADLLAEAMACVAWDGTVDTNRLVSIEFAHDEAAARRVIGLAATLMDSTKRVRMLDALDNITIGGADICVRWEMRPLAVVRRNGAWHATAPVLVDKTMTDEHLALYCALVARGPRFSMWWSAHTDDMRRVGHHGASPTDAGWYLEWRSMWMSRVVTALAAASGAWTGDEVMRTQSLARVLMAILRARNAKGPLATPDEDDSVPRPLQMSAPHKDDGLQRVRKAVSIAEDMPQEVEFTVESEPVDDNTTYNAVHAVALLQLIVNSTQRVYETQSLYTQVILPAEYDALQRNTPAGAFK
ncbi:hypothetical protein pqer_cds_1012 [Pandoravirus quercus]|uniref:Uncharacterized protein n=1 Tax=Pandoravirus quercus TaxID=2107709 RepID=A0A2U7UAH2_9VIRU|nr:hypothetical protein pqer_cds_1012 [Pandoravirus quercus]AVK75434.1 hypothetical protein pqer_cds_1012 [Pandoravirus quercus]